MIRLYETHRTLRLTSSGTLRPWLGPALRGLTLARLKAARCRHSPAEQETTWRYCKGCPHMADCPVGATFEADPPAGAALRGQEDGVRPVVLSPRFGLPTVGRPGLTVPVKAAFVGEPAAAHAAAVWQAVAAAGTGGGPVLFRVEPGGVADGWRELVLPASADGPAVTAVRVELDGPLMLRRGAAEGRSRGMIAEPTFADLLRAGLRTLGALLRYAGRDGGIDFRGLREAAERVPTRASAYRPFAQGTRSNRRGQEGEVRGEVGGAEYGPVPAALVRWLAAAGRVHVGLHRVAGAGGWRVWWDGGGDDWQAVE